MSKAYTHPAFVPVNVGGHTERWYTFFMTDNNTYKTRLEEELALVTKELEGIGAKISDETGDWVAVPESHKTEADPNIVADTAEDWKARDAVLSDLEVRYRNINRALEKIEKGTFGTCEIGDEEIEADRLSANPAARTCKAHIEKENELPLQ